MVDEKMEVLFVDDEENILNTIRRAMIIEPYVCYFANSGLEALKIMAENNIDIIIADMKMPAMSGLQLIKKVEEDYPNTIKIILSGYAQLSQVITTINNVDLYKFMLKPWEDGEWHNTLDAASNYIKLNKRKNKELEELKKENSMYKKSKETNEVVDEINIKNIQNGKIILSKFFKNLNFLLSIEKEKKFLNLAMTLEQLYEVYIENLSTVTSSYTNKDLISFLKSQKIDLETLGELDNTKYIGNPGLIKYIINEMTEYMYILTEKKKIKVIFEIFKNNFEIKFIVPLGPEINENGNIWLETKLLPKYIDFTKDILKISGINLNITDNAGDMHIILTNEKK
ncbi:MAG TPA: hypothetical protein DEP72_00600 [Clostridiales bacterium]|nr:MAG: hypothetical protein A2Y18_02980 [Clostridiales bacterium GWD2_32_19]HCC06651.1 hypothetical protein [Clostridiales bacterium]